jgi:hypothetical protein
VLAGIGSPAPGALGIHSPAAETALAIAAVVVPVTFGLMIAPKRRAPGIRFFSQDTNEISLVLVMEAGCRRSWRPRSC